MASRCLIRGSINIDEFFHLKSIVRPGETISSHGLSKRAGGKGANQAVAVAKAGAVADLVGAVGEDGRWVLDYLKESGVDVSGVQVVNESTGRAVIQLADDGENSIILFKGANFASQPEKSIPARTTHLLLQNEIPLEDTLSYMHIAAEASEGPISTVFNPSPMPSDAELKAFPWEKLTWLIVNEGEASDMYKTLSGGAQPSLSTLSDRDVIGSAYSELSAFPILLQLSSQIPKTNIVCTLGSAGVLALIHSLSTPEPIYIPAAKLQNGVVDTTGAGDCFTGYMVAGLMKLSDQGVTIPSREDIASVLGRCVQAAGMCVEKRGAMESIPFSQDVDARMLNV